MHALQVNSRPRFSDDGVLPPSLLDAIPTCRLLVVDDDEWMRVYLASVLRSARYEVDVVDSGKEALLLLHAGSYDILLTDCQMPGMNGLTLCQRVHAEFRDSLPYILMFTVKDTREDRYAGLKSGADEYIIKGAPKSEMLAKLDVGRRIQLSYRAPDLCDVATRLLGHIDLTNAHNVKYFARQIATAAIAGPAAPPADHLQARGFMEHRWGVRHAANLPMSFALPSGKRGEGQVLNISTTGAYLQTDVSLRIMTLIDLTLMDGVLPGGAGFSACVVRRDPSGVGLEWETPIPLAVAHSRTTTTLSRIVLHGTR